MELEILLGYKETGLVRMGAFKVDGVSVTGPPDGVSVTARAADMKSGLKARRTRSWDGTTLGDMVRTVAQEHGYGARVNADLDRVNLPHVDQTEESDMQLLTRLAKDNGAVFKPAGGNLVLAPRGEAKSASGAAMPSVQLARKDLVSWTMQAADRGQVPGRHRVLARPRRGREDRRHRGRRRAAVYAARDVPGRGRRDPCGPGEAGRLPARDRDPGSHAGRQAVPGRGVAGERHRRSGHRR